MKALDEMALSVARQFTLDNEPQRRARLQVAVREAMKWALAAPSAVPGDARPVDARGAEIARLRALLEMPQEGNTHQCRACLFKYTPYTSNEDCPKCGSDGKVAALSLCRAELDPTIAGEGEK